jgi:tRNA-specific 2-thiouridylase
LIVGYESEQYRTGLIADRANWVSIPEPGGALEATARIRSSHRGAAARVEPLQDGRFRVMFHEPQRAIAPGQAVVLYDGDLLLGGGFIAQVL